jgi:hypothetical protein
MSKRLLLFVCPTLLFLLLLFSGSFYSFFSFISYGSILSLIFYCVFHVLKFYNVYSKKTLLFVFPGP